MHIAILTFDEFNEFDSLIAYGMLNRIKKPDWKITIASPNPTLTSMNGLTINSHITLEEACSADGILIGSGMKTRQIANDSSIMEKLKFDPEKQLIGAQCSGTLILSKLGLLNNIPACTDLLTKPWVIESGAEVLNQAFYAKNNIATAGGCLSSQYLAFWIIAKTEGIEAAKEALFYLAPVGEKEEYVSRAIENITPYL